jgi:NitT/TauT family transport system permease protein/taurine transport system permease protein
MLAPRGPRWISARRAAVAAGQTLAPFVLFTAAWALLVAVARWPEDVLPSPFVVGRAFSDVIVKGILPAYAFETMRRILVGAVTGVAIGIVMGFLMGLHEWVAELLTPPLRFFQSLSGIAWLPLFLIWFGFTDKAILVAVWYTLVFPVAFNTMLGVRTVPRLYREGIQTLGGTWWQIVFQVLLPGAIPYIVGGVRLGIAYGWRALIAAEIVVGSGGLGYLIFKAETFHLTARIIAGMISIGVLWYVTDYFLLRPLEEATIKQWGLVHR